MPATKSEARAVREEIAKLPASTLYDLAYLAEQRERGSSLWRRLPPEALEEGLAILASGRKPTWAWWDTHLPKRVIDRSDWPTPPPVRADYRTRPWKPWELVAAAVEMANDGVDSELARDVLASLAAAHGLGLPELADAFTAYEDRP